MTDLQKQFEATGYASWINSELYPDGQIYTKEYTQWLEKQLEAKQNALQNEKIVVAIAAHLEKESRERASDNNIITLDFGVKNPGHFTHAGFCQEIAAEIAKSIQPLVNAEAQAFAGWICHQVVAGRTYHKLWLDYQESKKVNP